MFFFLLYFIFVFFFVCFVFLIFFVLTFLSCTGYTCRLNTFSISESDIALAKTLKCDTLAIDWIIVIIITGESAFIILALMEETSGKFQDGKTYKINEGSYKCVCICICIYLYIYIYILKLHGTENFTSERIDCEMSSERRDLFMYWKNHFTVSRFGFLINCGLLSGWGDYFWIPIYFLCLSLIFFF